MYIFDFETLILAVTVIVLFVVDRKLRLLMLFALFVTFLCSYKFLCYFVFKVSTLKDSL